MNAKVFALGLSALGGIWCPTAGAVEEAKSPHTVTGNVALVTDYRFRGVSQTQKQPAIQGGFDYAHASGFYLGTWASNVSGKLYENGSLEWDMYGGYTGSLSKDLTYNAGGIYYYYPGAKIGRQKYNTFEVFGGLNYKWFGGKLSYALTDFFGVDKGDGSYYLEGNANYPLMDKVALIAHYGYQKIDGVSGDDDIQDWSLGATYDWNGFVLGLSYVDTDEDIVVSNKNISKSTVVLSVKKTF
jgi:uncharacterized protein (TIGR02001 family)